MHRHASGSDSNGTLVNEIQRCQAHPRQPHVVVLDSQLRTPPDAALFRADRACWIYAGARLDADFDVRRQALEARGTQVRSLPGADGRIDLPALLRDLAARGVNELHVEAGATLNGALLRAGLVDEWLLYLAPLLLGQGGRGIASWGPLQGLADGQRLQWQSITPVGTDIRLLARVAGRDRF